MCVLLSASYSVCTACFQTATSPPLRPNIQITGLDYCLASLASMLGASVDVCSVLSSGAGHCRLREDQDGRTGVQPSPDGVIEILGSLIKQEVAISWVSATVVLCDLHRKL